MTDPAHNGDDRRMPLLARLYALVYERPRQLLWGIGAICAALALADLFCDKHGHYSVESWFAAYGIFGFVCFVFIVYAGKWLRLLVMRDEDYYDR